MKQIYIYIYIYIYDFPQYETIRSLGDSNCTGKNNTDETEINLLEYMGEFTNKSRRRKKELNSKKKKYI